MIGNGLAGMPEHTKKMFGFSAPIRTHFSKATCEEVACDKFIRGWDTTLLEGDRGLGDKMAWVIRNGPEKFSFTEMRLEDGSTLFHFSAGQRCFQRALHRKRILELNPHYYVRTLQDGVHKLNSGSWMGLMHDHQDKLLTAHQRG